METIVKVEGLTKSYKRKVQALRGLSLEVGRGEIFCLIGPDGAGKSSLLHILAGILRADGGSASLLGIDVLAKPEQVKPHIGLMAQGLGFTLSPDLSVSENIDYFASIRQIEHSRRDALKARLLDATRLAPFADREARNLSGGMKQKLALCCTLIHAPQVLLLDEPTTGVDPISRRDFYEVINDFVREDGVTALIATSYMEEAERGHRVALVHEGRVISSGTPEDLKRAVTHGDRLFTLESQERDKAYTVLQHSAHCREIVASGHDLLVRVAEGERQALEADIAAAGIGDAHFEGTEATMEYVFRSAVSTSREEEESASVYELFESYGAMTLSPRNHGDVIETRSLTKRFGSFTAVDRVSLNVRRGEVFGFLGPNGAGKTTLIKMLCGLMDLSEGEASVLDIPIGGDGSRIAERIGYMSQKFSLYNNLRAIENIQLFGGIYGLDSATFKRRAGLALELADLKGSEHAMTGSLPLGMKQRLALACAILHRPELIFLDEPTSGVDPLARDRFWNIIFELSRRLGNTVIVTTHYMEEAERCDRLILMDGGRIQALGSPAELRGAVAAETGSPIGVATTEPERTYELLRQHFERVSYYGATAMVYSRRPHEDSARIDSLLRAEGIEVHGIREREVPFDDVFIHYVEKEPGDEQAA